ncbi:MAG: universal stress protein [Burkholderiales bacterium]
MKILLPTDGSDASIASLRNFLPHLAWFAERPELGLLHVHPPLPYARAVAWAGKDAVHKYYEEESAAVLEAAASALASCGTSIARTMRVGDAAHEIVKYAAEWNADLIAMGTKGHGALAAVLLGSVAQKVIATSAMPVLLLR